MEIEKILDKVVESGIDSLTQEEKQKFENYNRPEMKKKSNKLEKGGGSLLIFLIFLILKLTGVINWSWWIVTSPLWIVPVVVILIILGVLTTLSIRYILKVFVF